MEKEEKLQKISYNNEGKISNILKKYDLDKDEKVSQGEIDLIEQIIDLESRKAKEADRDAKENAQRQMAWFALFGMLLYPFGIILSDFLGLETAANLLSSIAPTYFIAIAGLVAAFFGAQAYSNSIK